MCGPTPAKDLTASLPHPNEWPHKPVCLIAGEQVGLNDHEPDQPLPLGKKIEFETDMFKGSFFLRLKHVDPLNEVAENHEAYFGGKKRFYQVVIQGQFKEEGLAFSDIVLGDVYERPFKMNPMARGKAGKIFIRFMEALSPGIIFDIFDDKPKVLAPIGGCQTLCVDLPGQEPTNFDNLVENSSLLGEFGSSDKRRKKLSKPKIAKDYKINTGHVYTFEAYDHSMDFGSFHQTVMGGLKIDLVPSLNGQSMAFGMYTRQDQKCGFKFALWHERMVEKTTDSK